MTVRSRPGPLFDDESEYREPLHRYVDEEPDTDFRWAPTPWGQLTCKMCLGDHPTYRHPNVVPPEHTEDRLCVDCGTILSRYNLDEERCFRCEREQRLRDAN